MAEINLGRVVGSDAEVTAENIEGALGYMPTSKGDIETHDDDTYAHGNLRGAVIGLEDSIEDLTLQYNEHATGIIIESGSNENGTYVKFADGTLICTKSILLNYSDLTDPNNLKGGIYQHKFSGGTYAHSFNTVTSCAMGVGGGPLNIFRNEAFGGQINSGSSAGYMNHTFGVCSFYTTSQLTDTALGTVSLLAIGRWKI